MTRQWEKLAVNDVVSLGDEVGLHITDVAGRQISVRLAPEAIQALVTKLLRYSAHEPSPDPAIPATDLSITAGIRSPGADISLSCGKVRLNFSAPLADLFETI